MTEHVIEALVTQLRHDACNDEMPELSEQLSEVLFHIASLRAEVAAQQDEIAALRGALLNLRQYEAVEGRPEGDKVMVGLAYRSHIWGPCGDPTYETYETVETIAKWLHEKCDAALAAVGNAQEQAAEWNPTTKATGDLVE